MTKENPKSILSRLPRRDLSRFGPNVRAEGETIAAFVARGRLTTAQMAWANAQPVFENPDLNRLRAELVIAGFMDIVLRLDDDHQVLEFSLRLTGQVEDEDNETLLRLWITIFRSAGFRVGFEEIGIVGVDGPLISGCTLTGPIEEVAEHGAPVIQLEHG